jgi:hypothetical protein
MTFADTTVPAVEKKSLSWSSVTPQDNEPTNNLVAISSTPFTGLEVIWQHISRIQLAAPQNTLTYLNNLEP